MAYKDILIRDNGYQDKASQFWGDEDIQRIQDEMMAKDMYSQPDYSKYQGAGVENALNEDAQKSGDKAIQSGNPYAMIAGAVAKGVGHVIKAKGAYEDQLRQDQLEREARRRQRGIDSEMSADRGRRIAQEDRNRNIDYLNYANTLAQRGQRQTPYYTRQR